MNEDMAKLLRLFKVFDTQAPGSPKAKICSSLTYICSYFHLDIDIGGCLQLVDAGPRSEGACGGGRSNSLG